MAKGKKLEEESFQSFAKDSSIHGMQYVGSREHSLPRRYKFICTLLKRAK